MQKLKGQIVIIQKFKGQNATYEFKIFYDVIALL